MPSTPDAEARAPLVIPAELRPTDGRFGSGPSKVRPEAVAALAEAAPTFLGTSHRRPGVRDVVGRIRAGLHELFGLPDGYEVLLGVGGATAFWDAASFGLIERRAAHLVHGEFSSKFAEVTRAAPHLEDPVVVEHPPGGHGTLAGDDRVDAYCFPHNETSTGVMVDVRRPAGATGDQLVLVDATSAAGGLPVAPGEFDTYYFAPQKCFGGDGGLWVALCSPVAVERIERLAGRWCPPFLSLPIALANSRQDQTYNTPALATLFLLDDQIRWMARLGGLDGCVARCRANAATVYGWAEASDIAAPFVTDPASRSLVVATIDFTAEVDAARLAAVLRANGILDTEPYRKLGRNQLRIALFPNIDREDLERLVASIDWVIERLA